VVEGRTDPPLAGEPKEFLTLADWTGIAGTGLADRSHPVAPTLTRRNQVSGNRRMNRRLMISRPSQNTPCMCANQSRFFRQWRRREFLLILLAAVGPNPARGPAPDLHAAAEQNRKGLTVIGPFPEIRP
jgi:hypothetical protein